MPVRDKNERKWNWDLFDGTKKSNDTREIDVSDAEMEKLQELMGRALPLIEQVNSLYNQYRAGVERRPPLERRNTLEQVMTSIQSMRKPNASARFQVRQIVSKYLSYKDRWDRIIQAIEMGQDPAQAHRAKRSIRK